METGGAVQDCLRIDTMADQEYQVFSRALRVPLMPDTQGIMIRTYGKQNKTPEEHDLPAQFILSLPEAAS